MDFGRLDDISGVDWTLPDDPPETTRFLARLGQRGRSSSPRVVLGAPVWGHDGFRGKIYPPDLPRSAFLSEYARHFPSVELNSTFYGVSAERCRTWAEATPESFVFVPKLPRTISHDRLEAGAELHDVLAALDELGPRLGPVLLQLPPSFAASRVDRFEAFLDGWPPERELAVELRHPSWFRGPHPVFDLLERRGVIAVLSDVAGRRDALHQRLTARTTIVRFCGNALDPTDFERLDAWSGRLSGWLDAGLETAFLFLHQKDEAQVVELALHLAERLEADAGLDVATPRPLSETGAGDAVSGDQLGLFG